MLQLNIVKILCDVIEKRHFWCCQVKHNFEIYIWMFYLVHKCYKAFLCQISHYVWPVSDWVTWKWNITRLSMKPALYQDFFPHMLIFLQKCISDHETKQASKFQSDPSSNCFTIDVWKIKCCKSTFNFLFSFFISFYTCSVVFWHVIFWE